MQFSDVKAPSVNTPNTAVERKRSSRKELLEIDFRQKIKQCKNLNEGTSLHQQIIQNNLSKNRFLSNMLVTMYSRCGSLERAIAVFESTRMPNNFSWNIIISAFAHNGHHAQAISMYWKMQLDGVKPDRYTLSLILDACSTVGAVSQGKIIHSLSQHMNVADELVVTNSLIDFYGRSGLLDDAKAIFDDSRALDAVSWTSLLGSYAQHGLCHLSLDLFHEMQISGTQPDRVTFLNLLYACSQGGFFEQGMNFFASATQDYQIPKDRKQDGCMVDLLGRAGMLHAAELMIGSMDSPDVVCWTSLLNACRIHGDLQRGAKAARKILVWDPNCDSAFVMLSNAFAAAGKWKQAAALRKEMEIRGVRKTPGISWIEIRSRLHKFFSDDEVHPKTEEIRGELRRILPVMKSLGYVPCVEAVLVPGLTQAEKEEKLCHHSERLAIGFGMISTDQGTALRVIKNLRVCHDCHNAIKFMSKACGREILVRDTTRFHRFWNGGCSCGDYW